MKTICSQGWIQSVKSSHNAGAVGNTLEVLLNIKENNLPIPNAAEWELKAQRSRTSSLTTLFHVEPSPQAAQIVSTFLLPKYGWPHKTIPNEMSFRSTTNALHYTDRGFKIVVDRVQQKILFDFNFNQADHTKHANWIENVNQRTGLGQLNPQPYWGFNDLNYKAGTKLKNTFYVIADCKTENRQVFFSYTTVFMLTDYSFEKFLNSIETGVILIDFDARTHHNHGTKFRIKQNNWPSLYARCERII